MRPRTRRAIGMVACGRASERTRRRFFTGAARGGMGAFIGAFARAIEARPAAAFRGDVASLCRVTGGRALASWLLARRGAIEAAMRGRLEGGAAPGGAAEAEALRRFRSFLLLA